MHQQELQLWQSGHMLDFGLVLMVCGCWQHRDMGALKLFQHLKAFADRNNREMLMLPSDSLLD